MSFYDNDYVPVAERRRQALKKMEKLREDGEDIQPIEPFKYRGIAKSFWGKSWCKHLESFSDYENRLPRGRTYVRNGSVCHLGIEPETASARVSGSEMYELSIHIEPLDPKKWEIMKDRCKGKIGSLIELLQGKISDEIMEVVTDPKNGLFPHPNEIRFNCNCPDWADMCKHVAAAMYGIGVRLDTEPELLFKLRGVNHEELIAVDAAVDNLTAGKRSRRRRTLQTEEIGNVFGIDLDEEIEAAPPPAPPSFEATGTCIRELRQKTGLSAAKFAVELGVSKASVMKWEHASRPLKLQAKSIQSLVALFNKTYPS
jgi:uncharacterized Zn finger protein/DNA-binding XRE family transcriptional regulator